MKNHINGARRVRAKLFRRQSGLCAYCRQPMTLRRFRAGERKHPTDATIDHVVPVSEGGTHGMANLVAACHECNTRKGTGFCRIERMMETA